MMGHIRYTKIRLWQIWCFGQFYHSKIEKETLSFSQFSLVTGLLREQENIFYTRTTDARRGNILHCTAENSIPIPNF